MFLGEVFDPVDKRGGLPEDVARHWRINRYGSDMVPADDVAAGGGDVAGAGAPGPGVEDSSTAPAAAPSRTPEESSALEAESPWLMEDTAPEDDVNTAGPAESDGVKAVRDFFADGKLPEGVKPLPPIKKNVGAFSGFWGAVPRGVASGALQTVSSAATALSALPLPASDPAVQAWIKEQREKTIPQFAADVRAFNKSHFAADPETMGAASQFVYGLAKSLPKAIAYGNGLGVAGGAIAFGADVGTDEAMTLRDKGVDANTAATAGVISFGANAIGLRLPAAVGASRIVSGIYGAAANVGTNMAEVAGINYALQNADYDALAREYQLAGVDNSVAAVMGAAFGAAFWRRGLSVREQALKAGADKLQGEYYTELKKGGIYSEQECQDLAALHAEGVAAFADAQGVSVDEVKPNIRWADEAGGGARFDMPVTQGREWHMGPAKNINPNDRVPVVSFNGQAPNRKAAIDQILEIAEKGVKNEDSGFTLSVSRADLKKSAGGLFSYDERILRAVAPIFGRVVEKARLFESSADIQHKNPGVQGIHNFAAPVEIDGRLFRVQLLVRDYAIPGQERLATHKISGVQIYEIENPPGNIRNGGSSDISAVTAPPIRLGRPRVSLSDLTISVSELAGGRVAYVRQDGRALFDPVDEGARKKGGVYFEDSRNGGELFQRAWHGSPYSFDRFSSADIRGSYAPSTRTITLTPKADISTFCHEHAHWYLDMLMDYATRGNPPAETQADARILMDAFGIQRVEDWARLGVEGQRKYQGRFAAWTEVYLKEGKPPAPGLAPLFARFSTWLTNLYKKIIAPADAYEGAFGEALPELSPEVRGVLDRMYSREARARRLAPKPTRQQVTAARIAQAEALNTEKITAPYDPGKNVYEAALNSEIAAGTALSEGRKVDVSRHIKEAAINKQAVEAGESAFARAFQMGDKSSVVVLQNRDRSGTAAVVQMNVIAGSPDYGQVSFSRSSASGAPLVSFGSMPPPEYVGVTDYVTDNNRRVPVTYAVLEADAVEASHLAIGTTNPNYANPDAVNVIAGNGRMAGLQEAYNRGTASGYRDDLMADTMHGINPAAIATMRRPVLVRFMPPEEVTTGFVERSNNSQVLRKKTFETAVQDAAHIRETAPEYTFEDDDSIGLKPTRGTALQFVKDIQDPNAVSELIDTTTGNLNETGRRRLKAALFQEAYRSPLVTEILSEATDKSGMSNVLNALARFSPYVIAIRNATGGAVDLGAPITEVINRIRNQRLSDGKETEAEFAAQGDFLSDAPDVSEFLAVLSENQRSGKNLLEVLRPFAGNVLQQARNAAEGVVDMFGEGGGGVMPDMAEALRILREARNNFIRHANTEAAARAKDGEVVVGSNLLPAFDVEGVRKFFTERAAAAEKLAAEAKQELAAAEKEIREAPVSPEAAAGSSGGQFVPLSGDVGAGLDPVKQGLAVLSGDGRAADLARVQNLVEQRPEQQYCVLDDDGVARMVTGEEILRLAAEDDPTRAKAALGAAAECALRNGGIKP